jgi:hypothetical protein
MEIVGYADPLTVRPGETNTHGLIAAGGAPTWPLPASMSWRLEDTV